LNFKGQVVVVTGVASLLIEKGANTDGIDLSWMN
jgi:hypothetical protein